MLEQKVWRGHLLYVHLLVELFMSGFCHFVWYATYNLVKLCLCIWLPMSDYTGHANCVYQNLLSELGDDSGFLLCNSKLYLSMGYFLLGGLTSFLYSPTVRVKIALLLER